MKFILASENEKRIELLQKFGIKDFDIMPSMECEIVDENLNPLENVKNIAKNKVKNVLKQLKRLKEDVCIIGADTVIAYRGEIYMQPRNPEEAEHKLRMLSDGKHTVITAIYVYVYENGEVRDLLDYAYTHVTLNEILQKELVAWTYSSLFAKLTGGYSIDNDYFKWVKEIEGDKDVVYGLPLKKLKNMFKKLNIKMPKKNQ